MKLTYKVCCGVDVHKTFLIATIITSSFVLPIISKSASPLSTVACLLSSCGSLTMIARMSVRNRPAPEPGNTPQSLYFGLCGTFLFLGNMVS